MLQLIWYIKAHADVQLVSLAQAGNEISQDTLAHAGKTDAISNYIYFFLDNGNRLHLRPLPVGSNYIYLALVIFLKKLLAYSPSPFTSDLETLLPPTMEGLDKKLVCLHRSFSFICVGKCCSYSTRTF